MVSRLIKLSKSNSFFLFGPRGSGKSTLLKELLKGREDVLYLDLLIPSVEDSYRLNPEELIQQTTGTKKYSWIVIDEVQKLPKLLDIAHYLIENYKQKFIFSGSSARKLKRGNANLLAGRAFVYYLYPLTSSELGDKFDLDSALQWGLLPKLLEYDNDEDKREYLRSYTLTYLKEEIQVEQLVRNLDPFRHFLEIAAQMNGNIINYSKIGKDIGAESTTVQNYYSILEDTLVGFKLNAYHKSVRKRQISAPKFYFYDIGVVRALSRTLNVPITPQTYLYGDSFEHFVILEIIKLASYNRKEWEFYYLKTKDDVEIDLIIDIALKQTLCIEIKSTSQINESKIKAFIDITACMKNAKCFCFSNDINYKKIKQIECYYWKDGLNEIGL